MRITKHTCPRDCYDTCGMLAHVDERGRLIKVTGDPDHDYTKGKLCCKGYAYTDYVYNPRRITSPMIQSPRFSGNWQRISWADALEMIARKIVELKHHYGSFLSIGLLKGPGNYGVLAEAAEGLFSSLGSITLAAGSLCLSAGWDAQLLDFGGTKNRDPSEMAKAKLLILWGVNPAATAIHQMPFIQKVRENGGKVVLIDIVPTAMVNQVDEFIQVRPGGDGALALAILRQLMLKDQLDYDFIKERSIGWEPFHQWLLQVNCVELSTISGVGEETILALAELVAGGKPVAFWPGSGMQRYANGGQNMRAIDALAAASGNFDLPGGGIFFQNLDFWGLNHRIFWSGLDDQSSQNRLVGLNALARNLAACQNPPVKLLWITASNFLARGTDINKMREQMADMELTVTVDHFMTATAESCDLFLPATTCFESWDLVIGYWHSLIGINQQAINPVGECRSELEIARSLSKVLNTLQPGISPFHENGTDEEWLERFSPWLTQNVGIESYRDLLGGVRPMSQARLDKEKTSVLSTEKFQFQSTGAMAQGCPEIPILVAPIPPPTAYPYRFLVLHRAENLNTQFSYLDWINDKEQREILLSSEIAKCKGIKEGEAVIVYNEQGEIHMNVKIKYGVPNDTIIAYNWRDLYGKPVNILTKVQETDLGQALTGFSGVAYHDTFVNLARG